MKDRFSKCFNPLDRVKFVQILNKLLHKIVKEAFQSPRSGQICSNIVVGLIREYQPEKFQSPRSGQICSNETCIDAELDWKDNVSIP